MNSSGLCRSFMSIFHAFSTKCEKEVFHAIFHVDSFFIFYVDKGKEKYP